MTSNLPESGADPGRLGGVLLVDNPSAPQIADASSSQWWACNLVKSAQDLTPTRRPAAPAHPHDSATAEGLLQPMVASSSAETSAKIAGEVQPRHRSPQASAPLRR